jgi:hypothetical protein
MRAVMVCHDAPLALVVLHALNANGIKPLLVCDTATQATLWASRLTSGIILSGNITAGAHRVAAVINGHHRREPIDLVMASDVKGLRILDDIRDMLLPPLYPMPDRRTLEVLNDTWEFYRLVTALGLHAPKTLLVDGWTAMDTDQIEQEIGFPAAIKPADAPARVGLKIVASAKELAALRADRPYPFKRVLIQRFIPGRDVGLSLFARGGTIEALSTFVCGPRETTEFKEIPRLAAMAARIASHTAFSGVANFDARQDQDGRIYLLKCNPRFFTRLGAARACGVDFLRFGLPGVRTPLGVIRNASGRYYSRGDILSGDGVRSLLSGRWPMGALVKSLWEACIDPAPLIARRLIGNRISD